MVWGFRDPPPSSSDHKRQFYRLGVRLGGFLKLGYHFGGPYNKDYSVLGSILGYPNFGKLPPNHARRRAIHSVAGAYNEDHLLSG